MASIIDIKQYCPLYPSDDKYWTKWYNIISSSNKGLSLSVFLKISLELRNFTIKE